MKNGYLIKIIPPAGYTVWRFEFTPRHIAFAVALALAAVGGLSGYYLYYLHHAQAQVGELNSLARDQQERLGKIDKAAAALGTELRDLEHQHQVLRTMIGADGRPREAGTTRTGTAGATTRDVRQPMRADEFSAVEHRIDRLRSTSERLRSDGDRLRQLTFHVLNMRRLEQLQRAALMAAIPSLNPTPGAGIASAFGWRAIPWPEFHKGLDLDANYGDVVHASAAGTVVSASWDGGFGIKVDIDHGNGYHTYYCHLSRADVRPGEHVLKSQPIARVGSTGESTGPHLHYQIMHDGNAIDPTPFLNGIPARVVATIK